MEKKSIEGFMSSNSDTWETPQDLFDKINAEWGFTLDVCANNENAKCDTYFTKKQDALKQDWSGNICWMNPPYGREISMWVKKAHEESRDATTVVVALLPVRTDTKWFHKYIYNKAKIEFLNKRLKFVGSNNMAPFPSMVVVFRNPIFDRG